MEKKYEFAEAWKNKFRARGLVECERCQGSGFNASKEVLDAMDLANDGKDIALEDTFCPACNGYGWVRPTDSALSLREAITVIHETRTTDNENEGEHV